MSARGNVVVVAGEGESTRLVFNRLNRAIGVRKIIIEGPVDRRQFLRRRVEKLGLRTVAGQILFKAMVDKPLQLGSVARVREIQREFDLDDQPIPERDSIRVPSINAPEAIEHLHALDPAVVVVNGTRIIAKKVLEAIRVPFINTHAGITPLYRGVHGGYWALAKGDPSHCGVTVHLVDPGIDTGAILGQALISPTAADNFATYPFLQIAAGLPVLVDAVKAALDGTLQVRPPPEGTSRLWSHPTLGQYLKARIQNGTR
jgi:folate-dependent phosphoribosylglycinamide formyltransferase PurN